MLLRPLQDASDPVRWQTPAELEALLAALAHDDGASSFGSIWPANMSWMTTCNREQRTDALRAGSVGLQRASPFGTKWVGEARSALSYTLIVPLPAAAFAARKQEATGRNKR
ncbi:hypothetical protein B7R77_10015 [Ralstonia solanacearum K60]|uniref:Uncharacterized protein n=1 Tax=Ralstonia solanacearum K60 TaxID=1091042 RepID=A0AAP7ZNF5_RALSL|nr:hypothetical protein B7R77_10015 [Ralstonia solanacearum K60]CCF97570.1 hypothetical protein RSK60_2220004 [Ralstonia solanacearum K60]